MNKPENPEMPQVQIQLRPEIADGKYSNFAAIGHTPNEFMFDFVFMPPGMPQAPVVSRIIMAPENAKTLLYALTDNIRKYEVQFGEIKQRMNPGMPPMGEN